MILDNPNRKLQVVLGTPSTLNSMPVLVDFVEMTPSSTDSGMTATNTNGTTAIDILIGPAIGRRKVNGLTIYNRDTATKNVFVMLNDNGVLYHIVDVTLQVDDTLGYTDTGGWYTMDLSGNLKTVVGTSASAIADAINTAPVKTTLVGADKIGIWDSVSGLLNSVSFTNALNWFAAKAGNSAQVFSVGPATAAANAVRLDQVGRRIAQVVTFQTGTVASGTTVIPFDNTIPQITEGDQYMSLAITPTDANSLLRIDVTVFLSHDTVVGGIAALFRDSGANAVAAAMQHFPATVAIGCFTFLYIATAGSTAATTFKVRCGFGAAGTTTFNGYSGTTQVMGGLLQSRITITEYLP